MTAKRSDEEKTLNDLTEQDSYRSVADGAVGGAWTPERTRDLLIMVLTVASGATDATGFARLGGVFTSVMTGNMVLLGVSAGRRDASLAAHAGVAFLAYVAGCWMGARMAGEAAPGQSIWPRSVTVALSAELAFFLVFGIWWEAVGGHPSMTVTYPMIAVNAIALGIQSSAVLRFGDPRLSTTYLTGTLTHAVASLSGRHHSVPARSFVILSALVGGAGFGSVLAIEAPRAVPALPIGALAVVLATTASFRFSGARIDSVTHESA